MGNDTPSASLGRPCAVSAPRDADAAERATARPYALSDGRKCGLVGIPASAIERVEVLKDGASAVYGTDAIGGVINFILRKDFRGRRGKRELLRRRAGRRQQLARERHGRRR